jgi:AbrB family looped-hinge helix DNA binding protein
MTTTKLSSKGQVIIPKSVRSSRHWLAGQELQVLETGNGILLQPVSGFASVSLEEVAGSLKGSGKARSLADMERAIARGARERAE